MSEELDDVFLHVEQFLRRRFPGEQLDELVIRFRSGRTRTYSAYDAPPDRARLGRRHSSDFRTVNWYGREYHFTPLQAQIIAALWKASDDGTPELDQATLLEGAGAETKRLRDLFRDRPGFGVVIVPGEGQATFRLGPPPDDLAELL